MKRSALKVAAAVLLVLLAVGCSKTEGGGGAGQSGTASSGGPYQMKDPNVIAPPALPVVKEPITLTLGLPIELRVSDYYNNDLTKFLEEKTGIKIEFVFYDAGNDGTTKLGLQVAAGDKLPDMLFNLGLDDSARREAYGRAGAIIPLNEYIDNLGGFTKNAVAQMSLTKDGIDPWMYGRDSDGTIWGYMKYEAVFANSYSARAWYNDTFAQKLGMSSDQWTGGGGKGKVPTQEWFLKYLRGVRDSDVNGNGDPNDEIPLTGHAGWRGEMLKWLTLQYVFNDYSSTNNFWYVKDKQLHVHYDKPEYRDALRFINMMYREKLWDESALTRPTNLTAIATQKPTVMGLGVAAGAGPAENEADLLLSYKSIAVVEGPNKNAITPYWRQTPTFPWVITKDCQYPEAAFRWLDSQASDGDFAIFPRYGKSGDTWRPIQEGEVGFYGEASPTEPYVVELKATWNEVMSSHWRVEFGIDFMDRKSSLAWNGNPANREYLYGQAIQDMVAFTTPEIPIALVWTSAENEEWAETRTNVRNYVNQCLAQFATGQMDVERDWDGYLSNLKRMGADGLLELDRAVYARMTNN